MAAVCATDADCAVATADWCVAARTCDLTYNACVTWPRCVSDPWLGCLNATQRCVSTRLLAATTHVSEAGLITAVVLTVVAIIVLFVSVLAARALQR